MQVGTDIEPLSIKAALANATHNGVASRLEAYPCAANLEAGEPLADAGVPGEERQFDVVVANILQVCVPVNPLPVQHCAHRFGLFAISWGLGHWMDVVVANIQRVCC